jgi:hypothetical protein
MKPTPILKELKIAAEAASHYANDPDISGVIEILEEDVVPGINDAIKLHKKLCKLLGEAMTIAGEAIHLADQYAGGESETAQALGKEFEKLELKIEKLEE